METKEDNEWRRKKTMSGEEGVIWDQRRQANASMFFHLLPGCSCVSKHLQLP